jgi:CubicO group peptidase (beta-lactamase class C family)
MTTSFKPRFDILEDRLVPASVVIPESTFDAEIFGQNIYNGMDSTVVGFGYAITAPNGAIVAEGGGGFARTATDGELAFTSTSRMEIASSSKTITAAAIVKLLFSQDKTIEETIGNYFPASWDVPSAVASLTFKDLLNHTSGFNIRRVTYEDLKELVEGGPQVAKEASGYNTTNYSLLRIILPYVWYGDNKAELDDVSEADKPQLLADLYFDYVNTEVLEPLGVDDAATGHTSPTPTLLYNFPDDGTPGYETPDQRLHVGGMGWNLSAAQMATFMAGLGNHPDFSAVYQAMKDDQLGLSDTSTGLFGTYYGKGGNNFPENNDDGGGSGPNRANTFMVDFPNDVQVALVKNSDGGVPVLKDSYENAWTGLVIQSDSHNNTFELRLNALDPDLLDLVVDGSPFFSFRIDVLHSLELRGLGGDDRFIIEDVPDSLDLILDGGTGDDHFEIGDPGGNSVFDTVLGNLTILGGSGSDDVDIKDANGIGSDYSILGIHNTEITYDGIISASSYTPGKLFLYDTIEVLVLEGNTDPNHITVRDITAGITVTVLAGFNDDTILVSDLASGVAVNVYGEGGNDTVEVWNIAAGSTVNVFGDNPALPGGADTLSVGQGDLGTVKGSVFFEGAGGADLMVLDDQDSPAGRDFQFQKGSVTASGGFGGATYSNLVETVRLLGSKHNGNVNVEALDLRTDLDLYGNLGNDVFTVAELSHNVDLVAGDVTIHGEKGYAPNQEINAAAAVDKDQLFVFDDQNGSPSHFTIGLHGGLLHGAVNKFGIHDLPLLNVIYDQIESTELQAGNGGNHIAVNAAPWFNQVSVHAGGDNDDIDVESTPLFTAPMQIYDGAGADTIRVSPLGKTLGSLQSLLTIHGDSGAAGEIDQLILTDALSANVAPYTLSKTALSRAGSAGVGYSGIENLSISLNNLPNNVAVNSTSQGTTVFIDGMAGNDRLIARNPASPVTFIGGAGANDSARLIGTNSNDTINVQGNAMALGNGRLTSFVERREVDALLGRDRLALLGTAGTNDAFLIWPSTTQYAGRVNPNPFTPIFYEHLEEMIAQGNAGDNDSLQINGQTTAGVLGGGVHPDRFAINLAAAGTTKDPFLVLRNSLSQSLLTLTNYQGVAVPKVNGLQGADVFDVHVSSAGSQNRRIQLDGGGQPVGLKGDVLRVYYVPRGAKTTWVPTTPKSGKVSIDYLALFFAIEYQNMESTQLLHS